ncbi:MAG TPA: hypothetical protein VL307_17845 [Chitinophagaceae bacterium]|nr:hypothetical protein [Chitinophagaceae bacterium]
MKASSIKDIKTELQNLPKEKLTELCLQLAKYKKDNKEYLSYLLFEDHDLNGYINNIKQEMDDLFAAIPNKQLYFAKKSLRRILRIVNKHIRYTSSKQAEADLLLYFCQKMAESNIAYHGSTVLVNLYSSQIKKIRAAIAGFHEDLQYDYLKGLKKLE